jgi:hypothetical protein
MPHLSLAAQIDPITADLAVLSRARVVMQQLLLRCVQEPLDPEPLQAAYDIQQMLTEDLAAARVRLQAALS